MTEIVSRNPVPPGMVRAIGVLLLVSLVGTAAVRWSGVPVRSPDAPAVATLALRFEDRPDGGIDVVDATRHRVIETVQGEAGFLRGALRALVRGRRLRDLGPEQPFELIARKDGRLTLEDPATGERLDLESFGPTNFGVFAHMLSIDR